MTVDVRENSASIIYIKNTINIGDIFNITFKFLENDRNIKVFLRKNDHSQLDLTLNNDYSINLSNGTNNVWGVVKFLKSFSSIAKVCIYRDVPVSQEKIFDSQTIFSSTIEQGLDKLTMLMQDNQLKNNVIRTPADEIILDDKLVLPTATERIEKYLYFDRHGKVTAVESEGLVRSLRQGGREEDIDPTFELRKADRIGKIISFDDNGSVDLKTLSAVATSGDYNDLSNKLTAGENVQISSGNVVSATDTTYTAGKNIEIDANNVISSQSDPQVNSDWNATSGVAEVLNKPVLSTVATSGRYSDLTEKLTAGANVQISGTTVSATDTTYTAGTNITIDGSNVISSQSDPQVNSDWNATTGVAKILNKPSLATVATSGNYNDLSNKLTAGSGLNRTASGELYLVPASTSLGGVYKNTYLTNDLLSIEPDGQIFAALPTATNRTLGGIKVGSGLEMSFDGTLSATGGGSGASFIPNEAIFTGAAITEYTGLGEQYDFGGLQTTCCAVSAMIDGKLMFFVAINEAFHKSFNCKDWTKTAQESASNVKKLYSSGNNIFFFNDRNEIFISSDALESHRRLSIAPTTINSLFINGNYIIACCQKGVVYCSLDLGSTWFSINSGNTSHSFLKASVSNNEYYTIVPTGSNGALYRINIGLRSMTNVSTLPHPPVDMFFDGTRALITAKHSGYPQSYIYQLNADGTPLQVQSLGTSIVSIAGKNGDYIYVSGSEYAGVSYSVRNPAFTGAESIPVPNIKELGYNLDTGLFTAFDNNKLLVSCKMYKIG